jgi:transposase-like protein
MRNCGNCQGQKQHGLLDVDDPLTEALRRDVRQKVERLLNEEIDAALGAGAYERAASRVGYRNGVREREISTPLGKKRVGVPRDTTSRNTAA